MMAVKAWRCVPGLGSRALQAVLHNYTLLFQVNHTHALSAFSTVVPRYQGISLLPQQSGFSAHLSIDLLGGPTSIMQAFS